MFNVVSSSVLTNFVQELLHTVMDSLDKELDQFISIAYNALEVRADFQNVQTLALT